METRRVFRVVAGFALLFALMGVPPAQASSISFVAYSPTPDGPVRARATFTFGAGTITIDLTNTQPGITSVGQTISGLAFTTSDPVNIGTTSITSSYGDIVNIDATTHSYSLLGSESPLNRWHLTAPSTTLIALGGGQPDHLIINTDLSAALNGSLGGQFNPFVYGTAHFVLAAPYATANTTVTAATFIFGTAGEHQVPGVPEPASLLLLGTGLVGLGGLARRRLRQKH